MKCVVVSWQHVYWLPGDILASGFPPLPPPVYMFIIWCINRIGYTAHAYISTSTVLHTRYIFLVFYIMFCRWPIWLLSFLVAPTALEKSYDCPSTNETALRNMGSLSHECNNNHNQTRRNKHVCIFVGIYCTLELSYGTLGLLPLAWDIRSIWAD